jgi:hypothetical protein
LAQGGDVVFVGVADFLDESVEAQPFQDAADMPAFFPRSTRWSSRLLNPLI